MAHECPECGSICYCKGDIDDICLNLAADAARCNHYLKPDCDGYEDLEDYDDDYLEDKL